MTISLPASALASKLENLFLLFLPIEKEDEGGGGGGGEVATQ